MKPVAFFAVILACCATTVLSRDAFADCLVCAADLCLTAECPAYPQAKCTMSRCGCEAEFYLNGKKVDCGCRVCSADLCQTAECPAYPQATCTMSRCGCEAEFYVNGQKVDCDVIKSSCAHQGQRCGYLVRNGFGYYRKECCPRLKCCTAIKTSELPHISMEATGTCLPLYTDCEML